MQSIAYVNGSDGSGNASLMTVQNVRAGGASTIQVNTVLGVPDKFYASMGTPHTFTDPVTSETITVISEATAVDFAGHVDGSNIEIDQIAPGYTDIGSAVGDVIIIRPVTEWANNLANILAASLEDNGSPKPLTKNPTGMIAPYAGFTAPDGWLLCDGAAVSRSTYADLFALLNPTVGTFTITIASPGVVTLVGHGLLTSDPIYITTTGALPTGLTTNTRYWVIKVTDDTFRLATSQANADAGTAINTSGSQSGVHTLRRSPYGVGNGSTTFNVPDYRGRVLVGLDASQTEFNTLGKSVGAKTHTHPLSGNGYALITGQGGLFHQGKRSGVTAWAYNVEKTGFGEAAASGNETTASNLGGTTDNGSTLQPSLGLNYLVKT